MKEILKFFTCDVFAKGVAVVCIPFFANLLGPKELGLFAEWFSAFNFFVVLVSIGGPGYILVLLSQDANKEVLVIQKVISAWMEWIILIFVLNIIFFMLSPNYLFGGGLFFGAICFVIINYVEAVLRHKRSIYRYFFLQLFLVVVTSIVPLIFVYYEHSWEARVEGYLVGIFFLATIIYILYGRKIKLQLIDRDFRVSAFKFGSPIVVTGMMSWLKLGVDVQLLKFYSDYSTSGLLFFSFQIISIISIVSASLNRSSIPAFYKLIHNNQYKQFWRLAAKLMVFLCVLTAVVVFASYLLVGFYLPEYRQAMFLIAPMAIGAIIHGLGQFIAAIYMYHKKTYRLTMCTIVGSVFHPVSSFLFIYYIDWIWVGWSYVLSSMVFMLMITLNLRKVY